MGLSKLYIGKFDSVFQVLRNVLFQWQVFENLKSLFCYILETLLYIYVMELLEWVYKVDLKQIQLGKLGIYARIQFHVFCGDFFFLCSLYQVKPRSCFCLTI